MASQIFAYISFTLQKAWNYVYRYISQQPSQVTATNQQSHPTASFDAILLTNTNQSSHQTFTLPDGRVLSFATYGATTGPVVFHLHGFGDCRFTGAFFDQPAKKLGIRIVAVDRPGIGASSPQHKRTALNHAQDIRLLAAHLGAETYSVVGVSGGGPYALACAYALPAEELRSVSLVCGFGPYELTMRHSRWPVWLFYQLCGNFPILLRWFRASEVKKLEGKPTEKYVAETKGQLDGWLYQFLGPHDKDGELLRDEGFLEVCVEAMREHFRQGVEGHMEERRVMTSRDLGFELREVRRDLPVQLWYGRFDTSVSWKVGEAIAEMLGDNAKLCVRDEAHLSLIAGCGEEVLARLLEKKE
jgi:pimeloyl-ACP methyl ester carboxylesterase